MSRLRFAILLAASSFGVLLVAAASASSSRPPEVYSVGDETGRAAPPGNDDGTAQTLREWAMRQRFYVGDVLAGPSHAQAQLAHTRKLAGLAVTDARPAEDHRVLSRPDEGGARRSSFSWLRWRSRKRAPAPLRLRRRSCSSGVRLAGLRQEPEPELLAEPCQTAPKNSAVPALFLGWFSSPLPTLSPRDLGETLVKPPPWGHRAAVMLHELLLALLGFTGDFVLDASPPRRRSASQEAGRDGDVDRDRDGEVGPAFRLAPDLTFLQTSERTAIERLISLGFYYRELNRFATESRDLSWIQSSVDVSSPHFDKSQKGKVRKGSVYRRAIANGITEILSVYRSAVLQVEQNLLSDPLPILATVTHGLNKFEVLLPPLYELVMEIEQKDIKGGQLLNLLHKRCHCGVPELQSCIQRLLWHGHQVMFNQLTSWMVYGILQDQYSEFFIRRQDDRDGENELSQRVVSDKFKQKLAKDTSLSSWHTGFHVSLDMLPEYIHMRVAESILFAGKAIRVLRNPSPGATLQEPVNQSQNSKGSHGMQSFVGGSGAPKELPSFSNISAEELLPQAEADKIDVMLKELKHSSEFYKRPFESAVGSIRTIAANHLWQLVVVRADLNGHLKALKDYFLLAKGDFFQCFLEESRQLMRLPPRQSTAEADLMIPFQLAALKTIGEEDKYFTRVSLRMLSYGMKSSTSQKDLQKPNASELSSQGKATSELALDGWDSIALEYSVDWPLQLFFTPDVLSKYRKVFQYLIRLKRTQMELEKSWAAVMHKDHADFSDYCKDRKNNSATQLRRQRSKPLWRVREHMAFLIRNLQFYIQVDVIESQWNVLQSHVQDSHDFTELVSFHQEYLSALISQSFLDIGSVSRILDSIMKLCLQFCWSIEQYETRRNISEIDHITEEFNKKSNSLYTILRSSRLAGSQRAPFLRQFLMRLNFNSFFETTARGVMNSGRLRPSTAGSQL